MSLTRFHRTALVLLLGGLGFGLLSLSDRDSALAVDATTYANAAASGANDGSTGADAYTSPQSAVGSEDPGSATANTPAPVAYFTVAPCRVADTRNSPGPSGGPALGANTVRSFPVTGICGIPSSATAVAINLAVILPSNDGDLRVYPAGGTAPLASAINFRPGIVRANNAIVPVGAGGQLSVQCDMPSGSTDFFFDVYGFFQSNPLTPTDTPTNTPTLTPTNTPTPTRTNTPTNTPSGPTNTPTNTPTRTPTNTPTPTPTNTPAPTLTNTPGGPTNTPTNTPTRTPTNTPTLTPTNTPTPTPTPTNAPTNTPGGPTNTPTNTPTRTPTNTPTPTPTCPTITVTNPGATTGTVDAAFSQTFTQSGAVGTATFTLNSGSLPAGLGPLASNGGLSGTPTVPGSFPITVKVTDANGCTGVGPTYNLVIACQTISVTNPATTAGIYNTAFSQNFTQSGAHASATFTLGSGTLPTGLMLATNGTLSGTPTQTGSFPITVKVTDANSCTGTGGTYTLTVRPNAVNDTYPQTVIGNVSVNSALIPYSVTSNDVFPAGTTISAFDATSLHGGTVAMTTSGGGMGQLTYNPAAGYTGSDSFTYTLSSNGQTSTATVSLSVSGIIWFLNNNVGAGDGRLLSPFNSLAAFQAVNDGVGNHPAANANIFLYDSATAYTGPVTLLNGQKLIGQDATSSLATITGLTPGSSSATLPSTGGGSPNKVSITSAGNGVTLGSGNTVWGLTLGNAAGTALTGASVGGLKIRDLAVNTTGAAISLANGALDAIVMSVSSGGGAHGLVLSTTTGSFDVEGDGASDPANTTRGRTTARNGGGTLSLGSGGTIQNATSAGVQLSNSAGVILRNVTIQNNGSGINTGGDGINASTVNGLTLDNVLITGQTGNSGLRGTGVTNLSMQHADIDGNGTAAGTETNNNWNVRLDDLAGNCGDSTNGCGWNNSLFFNSRENIVGLKQGLTNTTVSTSMTITNCEFRDTTTFASPANDAFGMSAFNSAVTNITATGSTFKNVEVGGFEFDDNDNASGTVNVRNSVFENTGSDILIAHNGGTPTVASTLNYDISGNTERQLTGNPSSTVAIDVFLGGNSNSGSLMVGKIENNTIGNLVVSGSGSHVGDGIDVNAMGAGTITATVTGNTVHQIHQGEVFFGEANSGSAALNLKVHNNSFNSDQNGSGLDALNFTGGAVGTDTSTVCVDMLANTLLGDLTNTSVKVQTFGASTSGVNLVGMSTAFNDNTMAIANFVGSSALTTPAGVNTSALPTPSPSFMIRGAGHITGATTCGVTFPP